MSTRIYTGPELLAALALAQWGLHLDRLDDLIDAAGNDAGFLVSERARIIRIVQERGAMAARDAARALAANLLLAPLAMSQTKRSKANTGNASELRVLTPEQVKCMRRKYAERVSSDERYGAIQALHYEFGVSEKTVRRVVADLIPKRIRN